MMFNMKPLFFLALYASSTFASPTGASIDLEARMASGPGVKAVDCDGKQFTAAQVGASAKQAKELMAAKNPSWPKYYGNSEKLFQITAGTKLKEFPLQEPVWKSGARSDPKYRVVIDTSGNYRGSMYHIQGQSNAFKKCTNVAAAKTTTTTAKAKATPKPAV